MENLPVLAPQQKLPTGGRTVLRSFMMSGVRDQPPGPSEGTALSVPIFV